MTGCALNPEVTMPQSVVKHFHTPADFLGWLPQHACDQVEHSSLDWRGGESYADSRRLLIAGDTRHVDAASQLLDQLLDSVEVPVQLWQQSVAGYIPCVPAVLAGHPEAFLRPIDEDSDSSPIRVYASVGCSAGISAKDLTKRGIAILALVIKLQAIRPVELWITDDSGGSGYGLFGCLRIETAPLDLSTAAYALTSAGFFRNLCFEFNYQHGWSGAWAWGKDPRDATSQQRTRDLLGLGDNDLWIPGAFVQDPLINNPVAWVNEQLQKFVEREAA